MNEAEEGTEMDRPDPFDTDKLRLIAVTWNIAGKTPNQIEIGNLLHPRKAHHDIYVVGS